MSDTEETLLDRIARWFSTEAQKSDRDIHEEYVLNGFTDKYTHVTLVEIDDHHYLRCDLSATLFGLDETQELLAHLETLDHMTSDSVDAFNDSPREITVGANKRGFSAD